MPMLSLAQVGTSVSSGATVAINQHGECRQVTNPGSGTRMVFTGTSEEWKSFRDHPSGLTMSACAPVGCAPVTVMPNQPNDPVAGRCCKTPWGSDLSHGASIGAYSSQTAPCQSVSLTCQNGILLGHLGIPYHAQAHGAFPYASCTAPVTACNMTSGRQVTGGTATTHFSNGFCYETECNPQTDYINVCQSACVGANAKCCQMTATFIPPGVVGDASAWSDITCRSYSGSCNVSAGGSGVSYGGTCS